MRTSLAALAVAALVVTGCGEKKKTAKRTTEAEVLSVQGAPGNGGVIQVVDSSGNPVAGNIFDANEDVYLDGSGLLDGDYYYLVTDFECSEDLAGPDAGGEANTEDKIIHVENGEFTELMQLAFFEESGSHNYQVKITPVDLYDEGGGGCQGFLPAHSKTDTFTVRAEDEPNLDTFCVSGEKFFDRDGDGVRESPDVPVPGIVIALFPQDATAEANPLRTMQTSTTGQWAFCGLPPGEPYEIREVLPDGWNQSFPPDDGAHQVEFSDHDITGLLFGNYCLVDDVIPDGPEDCEAPELIDATLFQMVFGGATPGVDDDMTFYVNDVTAFTDDNGIATPLPDPIEFHAEIGDVIKLVATDVAGGCRGIAPADIVRVCDGETMHYTDGYSSNLCDWPANQVFLIVEETLTMPPPGSGCIE